MLLADTTVLPKRKQTLFPILVVLFLVSYGLMTMLIVEQNNTISSQRSLIVEMLSDSSQLAALKIKIAREGNLAHSGSQAAAPKSQVASPGDHTAEHKNSGSGKAQRRLPLRPPKAASDTPDSRRALVTI
jgi:hypothetical protein